MNRDNDNSEDDVEDEIQTVMKMPLQKSNPTPLAEYMSMGCADNKTFEGNDEVIHSDSALNLELTLSETDESGTPNGSPPEKRLKSREGVSKFLDSPLPENKNKQIETEQSSEDINMIGDSAMSCFLHINQNTDEWNNSNSQSVMNESRSLDGNTNCKSSHPRILISGKAEDGIPTMLGATSLAADSSKSRLKLENKCDTKIEKRCSQPRKDDDEDDNDDDFSILEGLI